MVDFYREPLELNDATRAQLPGQFVALPDGVTHCELAGPEDGAVVVLIHGFSTPMFIWDPTFAALVAAGFRVLRYDLIGRGFSDRPAVKYNTDLFDRQLLHLLDALEFDRPVHLLGLSMGGAIAATFTSRHPDRVARLGFISPAGYRVKPSLSALALFVPMLGETIMGLVGNRVMVAGLPRDFYIPQNYPEYYENYKKQLPYKGFKRAILSTMRNMPLMSMDETYRRVGQQDRAACLIWGREDSTVPFANHKELQAAIPGIAFHPIDNAGHIAHYEQPAVVNPILIDFFGQ